VDRREGLELLKRVAGSLSDDQWAGLHAILSESGGERRFVGHPVYERLLEVLQKHESQSGSGAGRVGATDRRLAFDTLFPNCAGVKVLG
jgi:hypothetical protein